MDAPPTTQHYQSHRFPVEIATHAVWLYSRFCLRHRDTEDLLFEWGMVAAYEAIRKRCYKPGQEYVN